LDRWFSCKKSKIAICKELHIWMKKFRIKTLRQKTLILVLIPTFFFLTAIGWGGFLFAKKSLLMQWSETAVANLQRAAHHMDMRLDRPKDLLQRLQYSSGVGMAHMSLQYTLEQLKGLEGVREVEVQWPNSQLGTPGMPGMSPGRYPITQLEISSPQYVWKTGKHSVLLLSAMNDAVGGQRGQIAVEITIADLVEQLARSEWWKSNKAMLIDMEGNIIAHSSYLQGNGATDDLDVRPFGIHGMLEMKTLAEIQRNKVFGTVFGEGGFPREISGFYRLSDVPWYLVVIASGEKVLQPILTFRLYYSLLFAFAIFIIILFIRSMTSTMTGAIKKVSKAAENLANGVFGPPLPVHSVDEIGELTNSFNKMTAQIRQGVKLQKAMEIAREVQQNFLPASRFAAAGIEIYGSSRYSQETGGDFFDLVRFRDAPQKIGAVVGDVVGHGIGAALLMASVRAMIRTRNDQAGKLAEIISDVNRVLCRDTQETSNFVTLFYTVIDPSSRTIEWVRAGHDPALLLYPDRHECLELYGKGVALGIDDSLRYESNTVEISAEKQLIVIGSDGAWEAQNARGEMFGKDQLKKILMENCDDDIQKLIDLINKEIDIFLEGTPPQDDITFVVIKINGCESDRN